MSELHCYTNDTDTVVATSVSDAMAVWCETTGERSEDYNLDDWYLVDDGKTIRIADPDGENETEELTAAQWAKKEGRGFLCSIEY